jgi:hypothetical protein
VTKPTGKPRGRPRVKNPLALTAPRIAWAVFQHELSLGPGRGTQAEAIRLVAAEKRISSSTVKKAAQRYVHLASSFRSTAEFIASTAPDIGECERRISGFPDDVRAVLESEWSYAQLLPFLRAQGIDGTCPRWLIDLVRERPI